MNWFKENKFLSGLIAFVVVVGGVLGYLLWTAMGKADEANARFTAAAADASRLESLPVYPNQKNLKRLEEQRSEHQRRIDELQNNLANMAPPVDPITPERFQDALRESVNAFIKKATVEDLSLKIQPAFYMGMVRYQAQPPRVEAAPLLAQELKSIGFLLDLLVQAHVKELRALNREEMPEENAPTAAAQAPKKQAPGAAAKPKDSPEKNLLRKQTVGIQFYGSQSSVQKVLNAIATSKSQFFITRSVSVLNEKQVGPARVDPAGAPAVAPAAGAAPGADAKSFEYIVGQEQVEAFVVVEIVNFNRPTPHEEKGKPKPLK